MYGCPHHYTVSPAMAKGTFPFPTVQLTVCMQMLPRWCWWFKKKKNASQGSRYKRYGFDPSGLEDSLEEGVATLSSILAWRIPWTEEPGRAAVHGVADESDTTEVTSQPHVQMHVLLS